jgi:hypothetical protein
MRAILAKILAAIVGVLLFPFQLAGDAWHALWRPRQSGTCGNGAGDQATAEDAAGKAVKNVKASGIEPTVDRVTEVRRVAGRLVEGKPIDGARLSPEVLKAMLALSKSDLRLLVKGSEEEVAFFVKSAFVPKEPAPARTAEVVTLPGLAQRIAARQAAQASMSTAEFDGLLANAYAAGLTDRKAAAG